MDETLLPAWHQVHLGRLRALVDPWKAEQLSYNEAETLVDLFETAAAAHAYLPNIPTDILADAMGHVRELRADEAGKLNSAAIERAEGGAA